MKTPLRILIASAATLLTSSALRADVISVNFQGGNGNTTTANGPSVTGTAGAVSAGNWNNEPGSAGSAISLLNSTGAAAGTLSYTAPNVYGAIPSGPGTTGAPGDTSLMTGYLDNFQNAGSSITVSGLGAAFTSGGYEILVYQNGDSNGSFGFTANDGTNSDTRYGLESNGNGGNYPLSGTNGYVGSTSTNPAGPASAANYVILSGFTGSSFTLTGDNGSTGDGRPRIDGFQIVSQAVPEPGTWMAAGGLLLLAAGDFRRRFKA